MSDSYQAIYDAVRSRISGGNIGEVVSEAARQAFDISFTRQILQESFASAAFAIETAGYEHKRPSAVFRPALSADGDMWCALLGDNLQEGVAGFGRTPDEAMVNFDIAFLNERTPTAIRLASVDGRRMAETENTGSVPQGTTSAVGTAETPNPFAGTTFETRAERASRETPQPPLQSEGKYPVNGCLDGK